MPNGHPVADDYNVEWCKEKHEVISKRLDSIENKFWCIIILLISNMAGVTTLLLTKGV